jgi:hypothetical protein
MPKIRVNKPGSAMDSGSIASTQSNPYSGGQKVLHVGPDFQKQGADTFVNGQDVSTGGSVAPWKTLWLYNNASTVAWVALGSTTIATPPTSFATGIPLQPNSWTMLSSGENSFIQTSAATVGLYVANDDTTCRESN